MNTVNNEKLPSVLSINENDILSFNNQFNDMLSKITNTVNRASKLVDIQTIDIGHVDEERLMETIDELSQAQTLTKNVTQIRTALRKYLNNRRDNILKQFDDILEKARYNELSNYDAKAKQLKKDLSSYRINQRWAKLQETFDLNIKQYPMITKIAPQLADFNMFRLRHPKLVTGAKNFKITDKQIGLINNELFMVNDCIKDLSENEVHLKSEYQLAILNAFVQQPTKETYLELKNNYLIRQQEEQKLANEAKKQIKEPVKQAVPQKAADNYQNSLEKDKAEARQWITNYVSVNNRKYGNLVQSPRQKMNLIYDLEHMLDNPSSSLSELLYKQKDSEARSEIMLSIVKLVVNA